MMARMSGFGKARLGSRSKSIAAKVGGNRRHSPWGKNVPHPGASKQSRLGQGVSKASVKTGKRAGVGNSAPALKTTGVSSRNPKLWPKEKPATRADLPLQSGLTATRAAFNNSVVNKAFQRGGYAG